jgi:hypothetical protein
MIEIEATISVESSSQKGTEIPATRKRRDTGMLATPFMAGHCLLGQHKTKVMGI